MSEPSSATRPTLPRVSILIPVFNEEAILHAAVVELLDRLRDVDWPFELVLAENGSTDGTASIAAELHHRFDAVRVLHIDEPNYGAALRAAILAARGEFVICDEIDLCDTDFHRQALELLEAGEVDLVVGSKSMPGAVDDRPAMRRLGTLVINGMLRATLGFRGTDTHGLKAFRRTPLVEITRQCLVDRDLFASELVIRSERAGLRIREIPVHVLEMRPPSVGLVRRVPGVLRNLAKLVVAIRIKG